MSRKRRKGGRPQQQQSPTVTVNYKEYQFLMKMRDLLPQIEDALFDLTKDWQDHADFCEENLPYYDEEIDAVHDDISRLTDLIAEGVDSGRSLFKKQKQTNTEGINIVQGKSRWKVDLEEIECEPNNLGKPKGLPF